MEKIIML